MKKHSPIAIIFFMIFALVACTRKDNNGTAGKGGNAQLRIVPKHHNVYTNIINAKVYIKYNAQDAPSSYDDSINCVDLSSMPTAVFTGLKAGQYYLYAKGYDSSISQNVKGGMPYTIVNETTIGLSLPVTEE
jgi:hypothetical protein